MTMNHIHLGTTNLERSIHFYESFFGFKKKFDHGDGVFLEDAQGFLLALDPVEKAPEFPSWFHLGFCLDSKEKVKAIYDKMEESGVNFIRPFKIYGDGAAAFLVSDPDGYQIEVSWHQDEES
ncbi:VOC family protein [bacterium]|nr:VOC family protein [bacterium]